MKETAEYLSISEKQLEDLVRAQSLERHPLMTIQSDFFASGLLLDTLS
jgi:hypothetical protein